MEFYVKTLEVRKAADDLQSLSTEMQKCAASLLKLQTTVGKHSFRAANEVFAVVVETKSNENNLKKMAVALQNTAVCYEKAESEALGLTILADNGVGEALEGFERIFDKEKLLSILEDILKVYNLPMGAPMVIIELIESAIYSGIFSKSVSERIKELLSSDNLLDGNPIINLISEAAELFKDGTEVFDKIQDLIQWLSGDEKIKIPVIGDMLEGIELLDLVSDLVIGFEDFIVGMTTDDSEALVEGGKGLFKSIMKVFGKVNLSGTKKVLGPAILNPVKLATDYVVNMVTGFMDGISDENPTVHEVYYETFIDSAQTMALDACEEAASAGIILIYEPISWVGDKFGINLDAIYERNSDKKGVFAAIDNVSQFTDLVKEASSWENWTGGLKRICNGIKKRVKNIFS